jgi:hypothetical protein
VRENSNAHIYTYTHSFINRIGGEVSLNFNVIVAITINETSNEQDNRHNLKANKMSLKTVRLFYIVIRSKNIEEK